MSEIKVIFFDFDDTLGNREKYAYDCYRDIITEHTSGLGTFELEEIVQQLMIWDQRGDVSKRRIQELLEHHYDIHLPYEDFDGYWASVLWKYCVPFEDSVETLEYLQKKYRLAIISNGTSVGQRKKIEQAGLLSFFNEDEIFVSQDIGYKKPDVRLFQYACEKMGVRADECIMVGDMFHRDIAGARRAGMRGIWMAPEFRECAYPVERIHRISQLMTIL